MVVVIWVLGALAVIVGELWAVFNSESDDTITERFKRHWWSRGAMGALLVWGCWHFFTDTGGWVDLVFVAAGFAFGVVADRVKLRPSRKAT